MKDTIVLDSMWSAYTAARYRHERALGWLITTELFYELVMQTGTPFQLTGDALWIFGLPARRVFGSHQLSFVLVTA